MKKVVFINGGGERVADIFKEHIPAGFQAVILPKEAAEAEQAAALREAEYLVLHPAVLSDALLKQASSLKLLQLLTAGYDKINLALCRDLHLPVATNGGANSWSVAEHSVAMLLAIYRRLVDGDRATRDGSWRKPLPEFTTFELAGKTVGVLGSGNIGRKAAQRYRAFETNILYYDLHGSDFMEQELQARKASLEEIVREADILSVHLPLLEETRGLLGPEEFALMKPGLVIINTSRAEIIDQRALLSALQQKKIRAAGLDVFEQEPIAENDPLLKLSNVLLSPHMAGHSAEGWTRRVRFAWENIQSLDEGKELRSLVRN